MYLNFWVCRKISPRLKVTYRKQRAAGRGGIDKNLCAAYNNIDI